MIEESNILSGVPQGSILAPTLFLLHVFVNDLPLLLKHCWVIMRVFCRLLFVLFGVCVFFNKIILSTKVLPVINSE